MFCAISGEAPEQPVVSIKSGHVFEKRLIEKYISEHGRDPVNNEEMTEEDLIDVKTTPETVKPRPPKLASVPSLLSALQNEWDSVMLESFTLKQQYQQVRQELSHALYQNDAATRVIARLKKERDAAREALANVQAHLGTTAATTAAPAGQEESMDVDQPTLPDEVIEKMNTTSARLSEMRRGKKKPPTEFASLETVKEYAQTSSIPSLHSARSAGITAMDVDSTGNFILTGGNDKHVQLYNKSEDKVVVNLPGHTKKVTAVKFRGQEESDLLLSASADKHRIAANFGEHTGKINALAFSENGYIIATASEDNLVKLWDLRKLSNTKTFTLDEGYKVNTLAFDDYGQFLAVGGSDVRVFKAKDGSPVTTFSDNTSDVTGLHWLPLAQGLISASLDRTVRFYGQSS
ncbi:Putative Pre-mRNA-processing factor 19 [Rhizopus microsporus]|nr:Putative Pre-mRNA-processing factor 19 [Rhizopus microsporus]